MNSTPKNGRLDLLVLGLSVFLIFCLIFEQYLQLPRLVGWLGRLHPVLLHFPIVLLLVAAFLGLSGKKVPGPLLATAVVTALITAISGFFLGKEVPLKGNLLLWHQWLGAGTALLSALWYWLERIGPNREIYRKLLQVTIVAFVVITGHYGGMVTHGEDFLALPSDKDVDRPIPENPLVYGDIVARIIDSNCVSCHNANKQKGGLLMTDLNGLLKGGESGHTLVPGEPGKSEIIRRLHLPQDDEDHMPPEGESPLDENEILILERWIALGASDTLRHHQLAAGEPLSRLISEMMEPDPLEKWAGLPAVADSTLQRLSTDYLTIGRIADGSNALHINMFKAPSYDPGPILALAPISANIVQMDLSGLPVGDEEMALVAGCHNLEWLELDRTAVTDRHMAELAGLSELRSLKIYDTDISDKSVAGLKKFKNLKSLYLWKTRVSERGLESLRITNPGLSINTGIDPQTEAFFAANDSVPK